MRCPLCGAELSTRKTVGLSDSLVQRTRSCRNPLCPYVDKTFEMLPTASVECMLDGLCDLFKDIAKTVGAETVTCRLTKLNAEITRIN